MKKNIITIMMAFAALFMTQCKKQAEQQANDPAGATIEVTLRVENNTDKTEITPAGIVNWQQGDRIYIVGSEQGLVGSVFAMANGNPTYFEGNMTVLTEPQTLRFYYVGDQDFVLDGSGNYTFDISEQDGTLAGIGAHNQLMFGMSSGPVAVDASNLGTISMTSLMAIAHMNIACNGVPQTRVRVVGLTTSTFNAKNYNGTDPIPSTSGHITMNFTSPATSADCYLALLPGAQALHIGGSGCEAYLNEKNIAANKFYSSGTPLQVVMEVSGSPVEGEIDGHSWINFNDQPCDDFGVADLPLWAKFNVGVDENDLDEVEDWYGKYYAWGETAGYNEPMKGEQIIPPYIVVPNDYEPGVVKTIYSWGYYKWGWSNAETCQYKYNSTDGLTSLEPEDDAATDNWSGPWRTPTRGGADAGKVEGEWEKLVRNTHFKWEYDYNGIEGLNGFVVYKVKAAADKGLVTYDVNCGDPGPVWETYYIDEEDESIFANLTATYSLSDPHIFLPAAGYTYGYQTYNEFLYVGESGMYWSSSLNVDKAQAYIIDFDATVDFFEEEAFMRKERRCGLTVRPVSDVPDTSGSNTAGDFNPQTW